MRLPVRRANALARIASEKHPLALMTPPPVGLRWGSRWRRWWREYLHRVRRPGRRRVTRAVPRDDSINVALKRNQSSAIIQAVLRRRQIGVIPLRRAVRVARQPHALHLKACDCQLTRYGTPRKMHLEIAANAGVHRLDVHRTAHILRRWRRR